MNHALHWIGQALLYGCFALVVGVFSRWPTYRPMAPDTAQIKVSFLHHGARLAECRRYSAEEIAKMPPNMRKTVQCGRERAPVSIEVDIDGTPALRHTAAPSGLSRDGASTMYRRINLPAGEHHIAVRLKDSPAPQAPIYTREATVTLQPAQVMVIDFNQAKGGIVLQ